jgi:hypothetical protein
MQGDIVRFDIVVTGADELKAKLAEMSNIEKRNVIKPALEAGIAPILSGVEANAVSMVGGKMGSLLASYAVARHWKRKVNGGYGMSVAESRDGNEEFVYTAKHSRYKSGRSYIPAAIEYGHITPTGKHVEAIPYIRAAAEVGGKIGQQILAKELARGIEAMWRTKTAVAMSGGGDKFGSE